MKGIMLVAVLLFGIQAGLSARDLKTEQYIMGLTINETNILMGFLSQEADRDNVDIIIVALRRVGQLKVYSFYPIVRSKIDTWAKSATISGQNTAHYQAAFNEAVRTLGKISLEPKDADALLFRYIEMRAATSRYYIIEALGNMVGVSNAVAALNEIANTPEKYLMQDGLPDKRLIAKLLDSIEAQNHKSSAIPIGKWGGNFRIGADLDNRRNEVINYILKNGASW